MTRWERQGATLTPRGSPSANVGVGERRAATLRRAYLTGRLIEWVDCILAAPYAVAPPAMSRRHHYQPSYEGAAIVDALRDNAAYRRKRAA